MTGTLSYAAGILAGLDHLLATHPEVFVIGQGLWSPWYVGETMTGLEQKYGTGRVIDTPVSEMACTGTALGASLCGYRPVVTHPRVDFALLAIDQIVNQAAKWSSMFGGKAPAPVVFRCIVNRGGEQGAQHSQSLHSWFAHVPGLRVVIPSSPLDARDLLVASVLSDDPVMFMDDRWLYELEEPDQTLVELDLAAEGPRRVVAGDDVTVVGAGYSVHLARLAAQQMTTSGIGCDVIDLRIINPLDMDLVRQSVRRTGRLLAIDGDWRICGLAGEIIAGVSEELDPSEWRARPRRLTLPDAPAPTSKALEDIYYPTVDDVCRALTELTATSI